MKIEFTKAHKFYLKNQKKLHKVIEGQVIELEDEKRAQRFIDKGVAKKAGNKKVTKNDKDADNEKDGI